MKLPSRVEATMLTLERALAQQHVVERLWRRDASLWHPAAETQALIAGRLGWLDAPLDADVELVRDCAAPSEAPVLLIAPDDAGAAARLWLDTDSRGVVLLDSWAPEAVRQALAAGSQSVIIAADRSSPALDTLLGATAELRSKVSTAKLDGPRHGARFGALSSYGLLAAHLSGGNLEPIVRRARAALQACREPAGANPGLRLGAALAALAQHGYDLLAVSARPAERRPAEWAAGLLAGALAKHGRGFIPFVVEPDRALPNSPRIARIELPIAEDVPALVATLQVAVAIAGVVLGVDPFDEPDTVALERRLVTGAAPHFEAAPVLDAAALPQAATRAAWLALVPYLALDVRARQQLVALRRDLEQRSGRPVVVVEPLRHGWATQVLHAGRPGGLFIALQPPADDPGVRARFELDVAAWRRMDRAFVVVDF